MRVLAFDTCFSAIDIALLDGDAIVGHVSETISGGHGERLLPLIEGALDKSGLSFADLDCIALTLGPGGFTGVRVGVAVARALALSTGKAVVGMSSLELLARTAIDAGLISRELSTPIVATADARKDMLYAQAFMAPGWKAQSEPSLATAAGVASASPASTTVAIGAGAAAVEAASSGRIRALGGELVTDARVLAVAAPHLTPLTEPRPLYVRAADAKPQTGKSLPRA